MKRNNKIERSTKYNYQKVGYVTGMCYSMSVASVYLKKIVNYVNSSKLIGKAQARIVLHDVERLYVVTYKEQSLWSGTKDEIEAFKKLSVTALLVLLVARIDEIDIKESIESNNDDMKEGKKIN